MIKFPLRGTRGLLMSRLYRSSTKQVGLPPGTLVADSDGSALKPGITAITYNESQFSEKEVAVADCGAQRDSGINLWINVDGVADVETIREIGRQFDIHDLVLEDITNTTQRPKFEELDDGIFIILKMIYPAAQSGDIEVEQISLIVKKGVLISFQERPGDVFGMIRERLRSAKGRVRKLGTDYLAYSLMDAIVDHYFVVMERLGDQIEQLDSEVLGEPEQHTAATLHSLRTRVILLRRSVWPLREVISSLMRAESKLVHKSTLAFIRDLYDQTIQVIESLETFRDMLGGMLDLYLSSMSNRMNEVMKVLTIIATIFIPLSFIAGVYGMNFQNMPELLLPWGYPAALGLMAVTSFGFLAFFKRKGWL